MFAPSSIYNSANSLSLFIRKIFAEPYFKLILLFNKKAPLHRGANLHGTTRFHKLIVFFLCA